jgi:hypothetical protein
MQHNYHSVSYIVEAHIWTRTQLCDKVSTANCVCLNTNDWDIFRDCLMTRWKDSLEVVGRSHIPLCMRWWFDHGDVAGRDDQELAFACMCYLAFRLVLLLLNGISISTVLDTREVESTAQKLLSMIKIFEPSCSDVLCTNGLRDFVFLCALALPMEKSPKCKP